MINRLRKKIRGLYDFPMDFVFLHFHFIDARQRSNVSFRHLSHTSAPHFRRTSENASHYLLLWPNSHIRKDRALPVPKY